MSHDTAFWKLTDHVCVQCHGRVLASTESGAFGPKEYVCAQCGNRSESGIHSIPPICCCSFTVGGKQQMRCILIPEPREPGWPVVAAQLLEASSIVPAARQPRYVGGD